VTRALLLSSKPFRSSVLATMEVLKSPPKSWTLALLQSVNPAHWALYWLTSQAATSSSILWCKLRVRRMLTMLKRRRSLVNASGLTTKKVS
jgi:hypothetical protein